MKKVISSLLCVAMVVSSAPNVFASTNFKNSTSSTSSTKQSYETITIDDHVSINMTKEEIDFQLKNLGFTNEEIKELYSRELHSRELQTLASFPTNPKDGAIYNNSFTITNGDLALPAGLAGTAGQALVVSKSAIAKKIVAKFGLGALAWSALAAGLIVAYVNDKQGFTGFKVNVSWRYGLTNDLIMGWSVGPVNVVRLR